MDEPKRDPQWKLRVRGDRVQLVDENARRPYVPMSTERNRRKRDRRRRAAKEPR